MAFTHSFSATSLLLFSCLLVLASAAQNYVGYQKPKPQKENLLSTIIVIQGLVFCKSAPKSLPLEGAVVRITCEAEDDYGFETAPCSFLSEATNGKGYFFATLSPSEIKAEKKLTKCRAFLELSSSETCNVPTDINKGISGAVLGSYRFINHNNVKLFSVGPFFFTSESNSTSDGY
ncbi:hypothetical protein UlMin_031151 [Ulmus minor]